MVNSFGETTVFVPLWDDIPNGATLNAFWVGGHDSSSVGSITTQLYRSYVWQETAYQLAAVASNNSLTYWASSTLNHTYSTGHAYWFVISIPMTTSGELAVWSISLDYTP
jgi:hypothetical protein